jgi:sec-independent protein translocase protein TatA
VIGDILQPSHLLFILVIALVVLGPKRLPEVGRSLGKSMRDFRNAVSGIDPREELSEVGQAHMAMTHQAIDPTPAAVAPPAPTAIAPQPAPPAPTAIAPQPVDPTPTPAAIATHPTETVPAQEPATVPTAPPSDPNPAE